MKKYKQFLNESLGKKKTLELKKIISFLNKNTKYTFAKYNEEFRVKKHGYKTVLSSVLFMMIDENDVNIQKAIRFNFSKFSLFSLDKWEKLEFNLNDGPIYNKPDYEMKVSSISADNISLFEYNSNNKIDTKFLEEVVDFINGDFELKESVKDVEHSPMEDVESQIDEIENIDINIFEAIKLNTLQVAFNKQTTSFILSGLSGMGKCLAKGTKVIMSDGSLRNVEDVKNGEYVMGPDSQKKLVSGVNSGVSEMYEIQQNKGINYTVNKEHILSLKKVDSVRKKGHLKNYTDIVNITIEDYLKMNDYWKKSFLGYKVEIDFASKRTEIDPYFLGLWLGDGSKSETTITNIDKEIIDYIYEYAEKIDQIVSKRKYKNRVATYHIIGKDFETTKNSTYENLLFEKMKNENLINNKHIPNIYLYNDKETRLKLLAGLIDSDGGVCSNGYEITQKLKGLSYQIKYLADSLGFKTSITKLKRKIKKLNFVGDYYRVRIYGDLEKVPVLLERKKLNPVRKVNHKMTGFKIVEKEKDNYYGFTVKDNLFLLEDLTVVHNTHDVLKTLDDAEVEYNYFKGNSTAAGLYELLFKYRKDLIILDDMDDALSSKDTADMLKSVLDTGETRVLDRRIKGYFDAVGLTDEEIEEKYKKTGKLPNRFEFTGSIIFITNLKEEDFDPNVYTRTISLDVRLEKEELLKRIEEVLPHMLKNIPMDKKRETLKLMLELLDIYVEKSPLNLRTLYHCLNFRNSNDFDINVEGNEVSTWKLLVKAFLVRSVKLADIKDKKQDKKD